MFRTKNDLHPLKSNDDVVWKKNTMRIIVLVLSNDFKWKVHDEYDVLRYIDERKKRRRRNEASREIE